MTADSLLQLVRSGKLCPESQEPLPSPLAPYGLDNVDCPVCHNTGTVTYEKDGILYSRDCECMARRRSLRELKNSGLSELAELYTFETYKPDNPIAESLLKYAKKYVEDHPAWFLVSGRPGSGKSHICTAICVELISKGHRVVYMMWRDESTRLKSSLASDPEYYSRRMDELKNADVLYIDDFLKGKVRDADFNLAFELLNFRYTQPSKRTIISTELDLPALRKIDEALARRIIERSEGYRRRSPDRNYSYEKS